MSVLTNDGLDIIRGWRGILKEVPKSRTTLWRDVRAGKFPAPIDLGDNSIGWFRRDIEHWKTSLPRRTYGGKAETGLSDHVAAECDVPDLPDAVTQEQQRPRSEPRKRIIEPRLEVLTAGATGAEGAAHD